MICMKFYIHYCLFSVINPGDYLFHLMIGSAIFNSVLNSKVKLSNFFTGILTFQFYFYPSCYIFNRFLKMEHPHPLFFSLSLSGLYSYESLYFVKFKKKIDRSFLSFSNSIVFGKPFLNN